MQNNKLVNERFILNSMPHSFSTTEFKNKCNEYNIEMTNEKAERYIADNIAILKNDKFDYLTIHHDGHVLKKEQSFYSFSTLENHAILNYLIKNKSLIGDKQLSIHNIKSYFKVSGIEHSDFSLKTALTYLDREFEVILVDNLNDFNFTLKPDFEENMHHFVREAYNPAIKYRDNFVNEMYESMQNKNNSQGREM